MKFQKPAPVCQRRSDQAFLVLFIITWQYAVLPLPVNAATSWIECRGTGKSGYGKPEESFSRVFVFDQTKNTLYRYIEAGRYLQKEGNVRIDENELKIFGKNPGGKETEEVINRKTGSYDAILNDDGLRVRFWKGNCAPIQPRQLGRNMF